MSGFMWRESLPFGSYTRTLRGKVLEPMSRSSHEVCSGRCHHRAAGKSQELPARPARHTTRLMTRGEGLRVSRAPGGGTPARAATLATATGPAPHSCGARTRSPSPRFHSTQLLPLMLLLSRPSFRGAWSRRRTEFTSMTLVFSALLSTKHFCQMSSVTVLQSPKGPKYE